MKAIKINNGAWLPEIAEHIEAFCKKAHVDGIQPGNLQTYFAQIAQGWYGRDTTEFWMVFDDNKPVAFAAWFTLGLPHILRRLVRMCVGWQASTIGTVGCLPLTSALEHGATPPDYTELGDYPTWSYDIDDDSKIAAPIPKWADSSATAQIHIVWCINEAYGAANGEIQWQADWSACPYDATEALDGPTHNGQIKSGDVNIPATAKFLTVTSLTAIAAASIADDDVIGAKISRIAKDDGADPTADPCVVAVLVEFTKDKLGEAT